MLALHRKYRPERFCELIGQEHTKAVLQAEVKRNMIAHAYLFVGPRGTGKTSTARILAAAVNCEKSKDGEPCTKCEHCKQIRAGNYLDLIEIDAASQTGVDNVREHIIESSRFIPQIGQWKTYLIDEAHMLSQAAWNALLKTLEEPPERVFFIFATTEPRKIPATILSRCQQFYFKPVAHDVLIKRLTYLTKEEGVVVDDKILEEIALRTGGFIRDAESLLGQVLAQGNKKVKWDDVQGMLGHTSIETVHELLELLLRGNAQEALKRVEVLQEEGIDLYRMPYYFLDMLRAMHFKVLTLVDHPLIVKRYGSEGLKSVGELCAVGADANRLRKALNMVAERIGSVRDCAPDLFLEIIFAELADIFSIHSSKTTPIETMPDGNNAIITVPVSPSFHEMNKNEGNAISLKRSARQKKIEVRGSEEEKSVTPISILKFELQEIKNLWSKCMDKVHERNRALPFILRSAELLRVSDNHIYVGVHYPFHYERLTEVNNRTIVENVLAELLGGPVIIQVELLKEEQVATNIQSTNDDPAVSQLVSLFGGRVVET